MVTNMRSVMVNALLESETKPVRISGHFGSAPTTTDGVKVMMASGSLWVEPNYVQDDKVDPFFMGSVVTEKDKPFPVEIGNGLATAVFRGTFNGKNAKASLQVHKLTKAINCVIEYVPPVVVPGTTANPAAETEDGFPTIQFDSEVKDFNATWEYLRFAGVGA